MTCVGRVVDASRYFGDEPETGCIGMGCIVPAPLVGDWLLCVFIGDDPLDCELVDDDVFGVPEPDMLDFEPFIGVIVCIEPGCDCVDGVFELLVDGELGCLRDVPAGDIGCSDIALTLLPDFVGDESDAIRACGDDVLDILEPVFDELLVCDAICGCEFICDCDDVCGAELPCHCDCVEPLEPETGVIIAIPLVDGRLLLFENAG